MLPGRRSPPGALAQELSNPRRWPMMKGFLNLSPDEFEEALRAEGASERLIQQEVTVLRSLQAEKQGRSKSVDHRRRSRKAPEELDPYVEAEIRRTAGIASEEVLDELRQSR